MLLLSMLLAKDIAEKAYTRGEPYTVIQQNDVWAKPSVYGAAFIVMCLVCVGYLKLVNHVELIIKEKRKP